LFALGCLIWTGREAIHERLQKPQAFRKTPMNLSGQRPGAHVIAIICASAATALGLAYMAVGGAPDRYLMINGGAFAFGLVALAILVLADRRGHLLAGPVTLSLGLILLATSLWGVTGGEVRRWLALGPLLIQPSLMVVPLMAVLFARSRDTLSLTGVVLAALALALQPDRGMAGALAGSMAVFAIIRPNAAALAAAAAAAVAFGATMLQADPSPAMPFVDQIVYSSFDIHPLAGVAVTLGLALLVLPTLASVRADPLEWSVHAVFGAVWAGIIAAAALGNHPTPLVGYGGSAIIGYLLSLVIFHSRVPERSRSAVETTPEPKPEGPALYAARS
jgi:cell division protein FtsW (lipid II flippase)